MKYLRQDNGISLVEVVASIVLVTIILISFFSLLLQTKKTNVQSETIHEAVYLAQTEMERIYIFSTSPNSLSKLTNTPLVIDAVTYQLKKPMVHINTCSKKLPDDSTAYEKVYSYTRDSDRINTKKQYTINLTISTLCHYTNTANVTIEILEKPSNIIKANIENIYVWR